MNLRSDLLCIHSQNWADDSLKWDRLASFWSGYYTKRHMRKDRDSVRFLTTLDIRQASLAKFLTFFKVSWYQRDRLTGSDIHVRKDILSLIRQLELMALSLEQSVLLTLAHVAALYPSIDWWWHKDIARIHGKSLHLLMSPPYSRSRSRKLAWNTWCLLISSGKRPWERKRYFCKRQAQQWAYRSQ